MKKYTIYVIIAIISALLIGFNTYKVSRDTNPQIMSNNASEVEISPSEVIIKGHNQPIKKLNIPKSQRIIIETDKKGRVFINKPGIMPIFVRLPQLGVSLSKKIEPQIGLQLIRSEQIGLGLGVAVTPSMISITCDKDISSNGYVGAQLGYDDELNSRVGIRLGFFF